MRDRADYWREYRRQREQDPEYLERRRAIDRQWYHRNAMAKKLSKGMGVPVREARRLIEGMR